MKLDKEVIEYNNGFREAALIIKDAITNQGIIKIDQIAEKIAEKLADKYNKFNKELKDKSQQDPALEFLYTTNINDYKSGIAAMVTEFFNQNKIDIYDTNLRLIFNTEIAFVYPYYNYEPLRCLNSSKMEGEISLEKMEALGSRDQSFAQISSKYKNIIIKNIKKAEDLFEIKKAIVKYFDLCSKWKKFYVYTKNNRLEVNDIFIKKILSDTEEIKDFTIPNNFEIYMQIEPIINECWEALCRENSESLFAEEISSLIGGMDYQSDS